MNNSKYKQYEIGFKGPTSYEPKYYYDKLQDAMSAARQMADYNNLSEGLAEKFQVVILEHDTEGTYKNEVAHFSCSWYIQLNVDISPYEEYKGYPKAIPIEPPVSYRRGQELRGILEDYIISIIEKPHPLIEPNTDYRFQFYDTNNDRIIATGTTTMEEDSYEVMINLIV